MKKHSKVGNKPGKPAYRTPATFRYRKFVKISKTLKQSASGGRCGARKLGE